MHALSPRIMRVLYEFYTRPSPRLSPSPYTPCVHLVRLLYAFYERPTRAHRICILVTALQWQVVRILHGCQESPLIGGLG